MTYAELGWPDGWEAAVEQYKGTEVGGGTAGDVDQIVPLLTRSSEEA